MKTFIPFLISTIAGLSTIFGALLIFLKIKEERLNKFISFCLAFSVAIMIGISVFDLIPTSFFKVISLYGFTKTSLLLIVSFLLSYIIITILITLINKDEKKEELYQLGILNMVVLMLHNLPEGVATFLSSYHDINLGIKLSIAIMLHNIPEGIAIAVPIYYSTHSKKKAFNATIISGLSEPLGALLAYLFLKDFVNDFIISIVLIIVAGLMITLSIQEMYPKALKYHEKRSLKLGLLLGFILVILNIFLS